MTSRWLGIALLSLIFTLASVVRAENFVLIIVPSGDGIDYSSYENRLRSELIAAGFATVTESLPAPIDSASVSENAARFSTNIAISISISDGIVFGYVSINDTGTHRTMVRPVPGYPIGDQAPSVFAVRATDVLHGAMLELSNAPNASRSKTPPQVPPTQAKLPAVAKSAERSTNPQQHPETPINTKLRPKSMNQTGRWGVELGPVLNYGIQSMPMASGGEISLFRQERSFGVSAECSAYLPVTSSLSNAKITVSQWMIGGSVQLFQRIGRDFTFLESAGLGGYVLAINAASPNVGNDRNPSIATGYSSLGAGLMSNLNDRVALALRIRVVLPWRLADILVRDEIVAQQAVPMVLGDLGLRVAF